ncbi:hypothetical protein, partial [Nisaea sp.]|uniref:hypothetical protein n=1 Tax=Nisaea sp. TaxID=2024842 RepID=UPI003299264C
SRRSDQSPEDAQTRHVRSSRSRIVAGENATVPPHRLRQSPIKGYATLKNAVLKAAVFEDAILIDTDLDGGIYCNTQVPDETMVSTECD